MPYPMNNKILFFLFCLLQHQVLSAAQAENIKTKLSKDDPNSILYSSTNFWWKGVDFTNLETLGVQGDSMNKAIHECLNSKLHAKCEAWSTTLESSQFNTSNEQFELYYRSSVRGYSTNEFQELRQDSKESTYSSEFTVRSNEAGCTLLEQASRLSAMLSAKMKCENHGCDYCMHEEISSSVTLVENKMYKIDATAKLSCYRRKTLEELRVEKFPELNELPEIPSIKETTIQ